MRYLRVDDGVFVITKRSTIAPPRPHAEVQNLQATAWISALLVLYSDHGKDDSIQVPHCPSQIGQASVLPKGYGSLRGQLHIRRGVDLTKPIYEQVLKLDRKERRSAVGRNSEAYSAILLR